MIRHNLAVKVAIVTISALASVAWDKQALLAIGRKSANIGRFLSLFHLLLDQNPKFTISHSFYAPFGQAGQDLIDFVNILGSQERIEIG